MDMIDTTRRRSALTDCGHESAAALRANQLIDPGIETKRLEFKGESLR